MEGSFAEEFYVLPFYRQGKPKRSLHFLFGFLLVIFLGFIFIPGNDQEKIILNVFFLLLSALFGFMWVVMGFYNKSYLRVTNDTLEYKALFGKHKIISLESIYKVEFFSIQGARLLGIRSNDDSLVERSIWKAIDRFFGYGYSITISLSAFSDVDFDKLALTIVSKVKEYYSNKESSSK
jgi:hypothetical protein